MRHRRQFSLLAILVAAGSACGSDSTGYNDPVVISGFERHVLDPAAPLPPLSLTRPQKRMLSVAGALPTPCPSYWAAGSSARHDSTLTITVEAYPTTPCAPEAAAGALGYTYDFFTLPPGQYQLIVVHHYAGEALPVDTAYRGPVVIP